MIHDLVCKNSISSVSGGVDVDQIVAIGSALITMASALSLAASATACALRGPEAAREDCIRVGRISKQMLGSKNKDV